MEQKNIYARKRLPVIADKECPRCHGEGKIWVSRYGGNDPDVWPNVCPDCQGTGVVPAETAD